MRTQEDSHHISARVALFAAILAMLGAASLFGLWVLVDLRQSYWSTVVVEHFPAVIGLPMAAVGAFIVVVLLRQSTEGPIEFSGLGFSFKGPSGAVVLWLMCFLGIVVAVKALW